MYLPILYSQTREREHTQKPPSCAGILTWRNVDRNSGNNVFKSFFIFFPKNKQFGENCRVILE